MKEMLHTWSNTYFGRCWSSYYYSGYFSVDWRCTSGTAY